MKIGYVALTFICLVAILSFPSPVHAQNQLNVITNSADIRFPMAIDFRLHASNPVPINDVRLRYTIAAFTLVKVTSESYIKLDPGTTIDVQWTMDMRRTGGLPPGTKITYWWVLTDKDGKVMQTDPLVMQYNDPRYKWRSVTDGSVTLYWYSGGDEFINEFQETAKSSIAKMGGETGLTLDYPINVYLYASYEDLKGAMVFPQDWVGAVSYSDLQTVLVGVPAYNTEYAKLSLRHELNHQVTRQLTHSPYCDMPVWLNEGLAVYAQGDASSSGMGTLKEAEIKRTLISARSLCSPFSMDSDLARQSYAESLGMVSFLMSTYGQAKMLDFLAEFKKGSTYNDALRKVYNLDIDSLDTEWQKYLFSIIG